LSCLQIKFANKNSVPFLAVNGFHGSISTLGDMSSGIQILLTKLNGIKIASDGKTATIGGGVRSKDLTVSTVTGTCECVSYLGPGLGGGHGWLQGRYGLISDQFLSMRIVLANGDVKIVSKNDILDNLYWSMKGAGHNFGIVTEVTSKIYDLQRPDYALQTLVFTGDKVEQVYDLANKLWYTTGNGIPVDLINWSYWFYDPNLDAAKV
jgi:FAD/FMN-containing dehydrogenase